MLTCKEIADFLLDYQTRELPPEQIAEFERHLRGCPPCVAYLETYEHTVRLCRETRDLTPEASMPRELIEAILAARPRSGPH